MTKTTPPSQGRIGADLSKVVNSGPAVLTTNVVTTTYQHGLRLTFLEGNPETEDQEFRTAVYMDYTAMISMLTLLQEIVDKDTTLQEYLRVAKGLGDGE